MEARCAACSLRHASNSRLLDLLGMAGSPSSEHQYPSVTAWQIRLFFTDERVWPGTRQFRPNRRRYRTPCNIQNDRGWGLASIEVPRLWREQNCPHQLYARHLFARFIPLFICLPDISTAFGPVFAQTSLQPLPTVPAFSLLRINNR